MIGCRGDELCNSDSRLDKYSNIITGNNYATNDPYEIFDFTLEYDSNGKLIRRNGGVLFMNSNRYFSNNVYDSIIYKKDTIIIKNMVKENVNHGIPKYLQKENKIIISNSGQFIEKLSSSGTKTQYYYNSKNQILKTIITIKFQNDVYWTFSAVYSYNDNGNLISIKRTLNDGNNEETGFSEISNYDDSPNPFKDLLLFDDTFIRSLSINNFMKFDDNEWVFSYDECRNIMLY